MTASVPFGYELCDKKMKINQEEAQIVRQIFDLYLSGVSIEKIVLELNAGCHENSDKKIWCKTAVSYILGNERYIGDWLLQKFYMTDTLPTKQVRNNGEKAQYYVENAHPAIIDREQFQAAQALRECRKKRNGCSITMRQSDLRGNCFCGMCGGKLRSKEENGIIYWVCKIHSKDKNSCSNSPVPEKIMEQAFCRLYYKLKHQGNPIFTQMLSNLQKIRYSRMLWSEDIISLNKKISDLLSQVQFLAQLQQAGSVDPDTFISSNNKLSEQLRRLKQEKARLLDTDSDDLADRTRDLMDALEDGPDFLDSFDAELFDALVEKIIVDSNERLRFRLKNGLELLEQIERTRR